MKCLSKANIPYPKIEVEEKNSYYAKLLYDDYAGNVSETTAIFLYIYTYINISRKIF